MNLWNREYRTHVRLYFAHVGQAVKKAAALAKEIEAPAAAEKVEAENSTARSMPTSTGKSKKQAKKTKVVEVSNSKKIGEACMVMRDKVKKKVIKGESSWEGLQKVV